MRMYDLILKKRNGAKLSENEIHDMITMYVNNEIPDYQMSAMLMAMYFKGMDKDETLYLTTAMAKSGDMLDLSAIHGIKVDKHSTGGVGDKTSLVLAPMVASCGVAVAKMSGRGLGHTGGTIDKLESFPGFCTSVPTEKFIENVNKINIAIAGQTANLAPADKKLYALRDVTATVDQMSLIASSIMSKKLASGADAIVLDVKTGSGAFMKKTADSFALAKEMVDIGNNAGRHTMAVISDMDQPLGKNIGNALEVIEAIETLKGNGPKDLTDLSLILGANMLVAAKKASDVEEGISMLRKSISSGRAIKKLKELVKYQGGNEHAVDDYSLLPTAKYIEELKSPASGYISHIQTDEVGIASLILGGGRETKESTIDLSVGIVLNKKCGDYVKEGETLCYIHSNYPDKTLNAIERLLNAYTFSSTKPESRPLIYGFVDKSSSTNLETLSSLL